jgi:hypothetical protein
MAKLEPHSDSFKGLDEAYSRKVQECEDLLRMLEEINESGTYMRLHEELFQLTYKHIPFEVCSHGKKEERLHYLEIILEEIVEEIKIVASDSKTFGEWLSYYPELIKFR